MKVGSKIRELRKSRGLTQEQLAEYLNISPLEVLEWEDGTATPDRAIVPKLSSFFEISADELFTPDKNMTNKRVLLHALRLAYGI